jgi:hypothetical protein
VRLVYSLTWAQTSTVNEVTKVYTTGLREIYTKSKNRIPDIHSSSVFSSERHENQMPVPHTMNDTFIQWLRLLESRRQHATERIMTHTCDACLLQHLEMTKLSPRVHMKKNLDIAHHTLAHQAKPPQPVYAAVLILPIKRCCTAYCCPSHPHYVNSITTWDNRWNITLSW